MEKVTQSKGKQVAYQIGKVIHANFPGIYDKLIQLSDPRKRKEYSLAELVKGGIMLFVFKEHGYNQGHKFPRVSFKPFKNYYQSIVLAYAINQFAEKSTEIAGPLAEHSKCTIVNLWKRLRAYFTENEIDQNIRT